MRFVLPAMVSLAAAFCTVPADASIARAPFAQKPVRDSVLAQSRGTSGLTWTTVNRVADAAAVDFQRQTAAITATIKDLWLIDVASPLVAANVRADGGG